MHECYSQLVEDEKKKRKRRQRKRKHGVHILKPTIPILNKKTEPSPPRQDRSEHIANLLCAERHDDDEQFVFEGDEWVESFLDWWETWLRWRRRVKGEQTVICVAHNF